MANRLKEAEQAAKDNANAKSPRPESIDSTRKKAKAGVQDVAPDNKAGDDKNEKVLGEDGSAKEYNVESEMNQILKRSPSRLFPSVNRDFLRVLMMTDILGLQSYHILQVLLSTL